MRLDKHTWPLPNNEMGTQYYMEIRNGSEGLTIHDIQVKMISIDPPSENIKLPVFMHHQHDEPEQYEDHAKSFDLHGGDIKNVDLMTGSSHAAGFNVSHISGAQHMDKSVAFLPNRPRILRVSVTAEDSPSISHDFSVWADENGVFQCEMN